MGEAKRKRELEARMSASGAPSEVPTMTGRNCPPGCSLDEAGQYIRDSVEAYAEHVSGFPGDWRIEARFNQYAPDRSQIQLWSQRPGQAQLWDLVNVVTGDPTSRDNWLVDLGDEGVISLISSKCQFVYVEDDRENVPLFEFHPQRFGKMDPLDQRTARMDCAPFSITAMTRLGNARVSLNEQVMRSQRLRLSMARNSRLQEKAMEAAIFFHSFCVGGRQIFKFPDRIVDMFRRTDVDGIPLEELRLPFDSFYMHFGKQEEYTVDGWSPDGVYVAQFGDGPTRFIQFAMTFVPDTSIVYGNNMEYPEPVYVQAIDSAKLALGIGEAVDLVYSEKVAELRRQIAEGMGETALAEARRRAPPGVEVTDGTKKNAAVELSFIGGQHEQWHQLLKLVVNGLAYLSAYPEDRERRFQSGAPDELVTAATTGMGNDARRAESKLQQLGYTAIHFCGARSESPGTTGQSDVLDGASTEFTWVRGHWRRQAHGPARSLRTLRWLMPFKRSINRPADGEHGHIYLVT